MDSLALRLELSSAAHAYGVVWGLLHDIASWPLSHTGEAGFSQTTGVDARELRAMFISGSSKLPRALSLYQVVKEVSLDHETLIALFDKDETTFSGDLHILHSIIHSVITPDTLEGMHRSGSVFNVAIPPPGALIRAFERDLISGVRLNERFSTFAFKFWRGKSRIYSEYINAPIAIEFESWWSKAIQDGFGRLSLAGSLELTEKEIVTRILNSEFKRIKVKDTHRYKHPLTYQISDEYKGRRTFHSAMPIESLARIFVKAKEPK